MSRFGQLVRSGRKAKKLTLSEVSTKLNIDMGLLSRIERGVRPATRVQVNKLIQLLELDEQLLLSVWLGGKVLYEIGDERFALEALRVAEQEIKYGLRQDYSVELSNEIHGLIEKVDQLKKKWEMRKPLDQTQLSKMREHFNLQFTYESNKIEGNTLTLQETYLVISQGVTIGGKSVQEHLEALNHSEAIDFIADLVSEKEPFTERVLNEIHYLILKGIDKLNAGKYRSVPVMISGSTHVPPQPYLIQKQIEDVFKFYYNKKASFHPVILAAEMHEKIVTIHPFIDGNGRTSRLIMNLILLMNGFTSAVLKGDVNSRQAYYNALEETRLQNDPSIFYKLILQASIRSLEEHIALT